jgi:hypothetical protein
LLFVCVWGAGEVLSARGLTFTELLGQTTHFSGRVRKEALVGALPQWTLRARWVTLRARWVTLKSSRWVTLRARWVKRPTRKGR